MLNTLTRPDTSPVLREHIVPGVGEHQNWVQELTDFAKNLDDTCTPANQHTTHDYQNKRALDAQAGWSNGVHTSIAQNEKQRAQALEAKSISGARAMSSTVTQILSQSLNVNINLSGVTLSDSHMVDISENNTLMVRGDGPESAFREATLDELVQIETESMQCSAAVAQEEINMNAYLNGETNILPDTLHDLAEENGLMAEDLSREDFAQLIEDRYANNPHIISRITGDITPGGLTNQAEIDHLPPQRQGTSAEPAGFQSPELNRMFGFVAATPQQTTEQTMTPIPTPAPTITPAPSGM